MLTGDNLLSELLDQRRVRIFGEHVEGTDDVVCARAIAHEGEVIALDRLVLIVLAGEGAEPEAESGIGVVRSGSEWLRDVRVVDTPGTNAIERHHDAAFGIDLNVNLALAPLDRHGVSHRSRGA